MTRSLRRRRGGGEGKTKHQQQQSFSGMFFVCKGLPGLMINTMMQSIQIAFGLHQTDFYRHYWQVSFISYTSLRMGKVMRYILNGMYRAPSYSAIYRGRAQSWCGERGLVSYQPGVVTGSQGGIPFNGGMEGRRRNISVFHLNCDVIHLIHLKHSVLDV